jgi:hypothetical protein
MCWILLLGGLVAIGGNDWTSAPYPRVLLVILWNLAHVVFGLSCICVSLLTLRER